MIGFRCKRMAFSLRVLIFLLLVTAQGYAQVYKADSLHNLLNGPLHDTSRVQVYNRLTYRYFRVYPDSAELYAKKAMKLSRKIGYAKGVAYSYNSYGIMAYAHSDYEEALRNYKNFYHISDSIGDKTGAHKALNNLGIINNRLGNYSLALQYLEESLAIKKELGIREDVGFTFHNVGIIQEALGNHVKALDAYYRAVREKSDLGQRETLAKTYRNIGQVKKRLGLFEEAREYFDMSLALDKEYNDRRGLAYDYQVIGDLLLLLEADSTVAAMHYLKKSLEINTELDNPESIGALLNQMGEIHLRLGQNVDAYQYFVESMDLYKKHGISKESCRTRLNLARVKFAEGEYEPALKEALKSFDMAQENGMKYEVMKSAEVLYKIYQERGEYDHAFEYLLHHNTYGDSLLNEAKLDEMNNMEARFRLDRMSAENVMLQNENRLKQAELELTSERLQNQRIIIIVTTIALLGALGMIYGFYRLYQTKNRANDELERLNDKVTGQRDKIEAQAVELAEANEEINAINDSLEKKVLKRTQEVRKQNAKLRAYGFANSHKLRAPLARILGLTYLFSHPDTKEEEKDKINSMIVDASEELDDIVRTITTTLNEDLTEE